MGIALALAALAFVDCLLCGVRAAAGRNGLLDKRAYYRSATLRAALWGAAIVGGHVTLTALLCTTAPDPSAAWASFVEAGRLLVVVYGGFATAIFLAFGFYFAPIGDFRVLTSVLVFGPLTLSRRAVVVGTMLIAVGNVPEWRIALVAMSATISMCLVEGVFGRPYAAQWRPLLERARSR
jgi:hypothetical protein